MTISRAVNYQSRAQVYSGTPAGMAEVGGIVLCGGGSRRMGTPKAWLPFGGETLLYRIARILQSVADPVVVVAGACQAVPDLPDGVAVVRDPLPERGPLQGLSAGLRALGTTVQSAYVSSCDVPFLTPGFVCRIVAALGDGDVAVPVEGGRYHPLAATYRTSLLQAVDRQLRDGDLRMVGFLEKCSVRRVAMDEAKWSDPDGRPLINVNTPEDYQRALRAHAAHRPCAHDAA